MVRRYIREGSLLRENSARRLGLYREDIGCRYSAALSGGTLCKVGKPLHIERGRTDCQVVSRDRRANHCPQRNHAGPDR